jgi:hypothetical protein
LFPNSANGFKGDYGKISRDFDARMKSAIPEAAFAQMR